MTSFLGFYAALAILVVFLLSVNGERLAGELGLDVGMEFDSNTHQITGVKHHYRVKTDDGIEVSLDLDEVEMEEIGYAQAFI